MKFIATTTPTLLSLNRGYTVEERREHDVDISKEIRLGTQGFSLQKESTSLTVKVSPIDPVVKDVDENGEGCSREGST